MIANQDLSIQAADILTKAGYKARPIEDPHLPLVSAPTGYGKTPPGFR